MKFPYKQTNKQTDRQTNTTNEHTCQNQILASNERAIANITLIVMVIVTTEILQILLMFDLFENQ